MQGRANAVANIASVPHRMPLHAREPACQEKLAGKARLRGAQEGADVTRYEMSVLEWGL